MRAHRLLTPRVAGAVTAVLVVLAAMPAGASPAAAAGPTPDGATGYDIGWPQCSQPYPPAGPGVAIVEVDDGHPWTGSYTVQSNYAANPCFASEWQWARTSPNPPSAYIFINHGNTYANNQGADQYTYGQATAAASYAVAKKNGAAPAMWWLDVETSGCWDATCDGNIDQAGARAAIQGNIDYLRSQGQSVGVYSTPYQWNQITGGWTPSGGGVPAWTADYNDPQGQAYLGCTASHAFAGGDVFLVQSAPQTWDEDYSCPSRHGYWLVAGDGGVFPFGTARGYGSTGNMRLNQPIVGLESTADSGGYWLVAADGGIFPFGDAPGYGSTGNIHLNQPIVGMARTRSGTGYWLVASDGGIFPFGNAPGYGSTGNIRLNQPIVGMARTADGGGYWLVARDGGIFPFGDAVGYGSTGNVRLNQPIVGMAVTHDGGGYWLVAADGGIFPFGDAAGYGSGGGMHLDSAVVGMSTTSDGGGYWLVTARGSVIGFGDAISQAYGGTQNVALAAPVLGISATR